MSQYGLSVEVYGRVKSLVKNEIMIHQTSLVEEALKSELFDFEGIENTYNEEEDTYTEVFEWWLITSWFADKLREEGEVILDNDYGIWWGRTTFGQAIELDYEVHQVAQKLVDEYGT